MMNSEIDEPIEVHDSLIPSATRSFDLDIPYAEEKEHVVIWCCRTTDPDNICVRSPTLHLATKISVLVTLIILILGGICVAAPFIGMKISYDIYSDTYDMSTGCKKGVIFCSQTIPCYEGDWIKCSIISIVMAMAIIFVGPICIGIILVCVVLIVCFCRIVYTELTREADDKSEESKKILG